MGVKRFTATLDFEDDGEIPDELPKEVPVYRIDWGSPTDEIKIGMARDLRYTGSEDEDGYCYVKAEMTVLDPEPDDLYSLFPPQGGDGWRVYAL